MRKLLCLAIVLSVCLYYGCSKSSPPAADKGTSGDRLAKAGQNQSGNQNRSDDSGNRAGNDDQRELTDDEVEWSGRQKRRRVNTTDRDTRDESESGNRDRDRNRNKTADRGDRDRGDEPDEVEIPKEDAEPESSLPAMAMVAAFPEAKGKVGLDEGNLIPEITGEDLEGEAFKLSDYQGKVIMLDFWGHW